MHIANSNLNASTSFTGGGGSSSRRRRRHCIVEGVALAVLMGNMALKAPKVGGQKSVGKLEQDSVLVSLTEHVQDLMIGLLGNHHLEVDLLESFYCIKHSMLS